MLENALVVKVAKDHVIAATRELMGEGWIIRQADLRTDPAVLTVQYDPSLPKMDADKAERMRKRVEFVYGKDLTRFSSLPIGAEFFEPGDSCRMVKISSTAARVVESGLVLRDFEQVERVL